MGLKPKNNGHANFYECCDLTKKVYLIYIYCFKKWGKNVQNCCVFKAKIWNTIWRKSERCHPFLRIIIWGPDLWHFPCHQTLRNLRRNLKTVIPTKNLLHCNSFESTITIHVTGRYVLGKTDIKLLRSLLTSSFFSFSPGFTCF